MRRQISKLVLAASLSTIAWSCNQKDPVAKGDYIQGVFVINEGNFSQNNGSISFFGREQKTADADAFSSVNGASLTGGVQGYAVLDDIGIILVDNSAAGLDKIEIVEANTFKKVATIAAPDIENPREVAVINSKKAYVSCWGTTGVFPDFFVNPGYLAVIDLTTSKVTQKITLTKGPENIVYGNGKLFVGTVDYSGVNTLSVVNTSSDAVVKEIAFDNAPSPIGIDANGKLWIQHGLEVSRINPDTYDIEVTLKIGEDASKFVGNFTLSSDLKTLFFVLSKYDSDYVPHGEIYKFAITDTQINLSTSLVKRVFSGLSGLSVDPMQGLIYAAVTPSFGQSGYAVRYRTDGSLVDSVKVGVAPTGFVFK